MLELDLHAEFFVVLAVLGDGADLQAIDALFNVHAVGLLGGALIIDSAPWTTSTRCAAS
jgi:hypothetical protein